MRDRGVARPKEAGVCLFGTACLVGVFPQQKWKFRKLDTGFVQLTNSKNHITFQIIAEDFAKYWKEIEEDKQSWDFHYIRSMQRSSRRGAKQ